MKFLKEIAFVPIILFSGYIFSLWNNQNLLWYINPRFELFTLIFASIALVFAVIGYFFELKGKNKKSEISLSDSLSVILFVLVSGLALIIKPATLSANIASSREGNLNTLYSSNPSTLVDAFSSSENFNLGDWVQVLNTSLASDTYEGASITVDGFIVSESDSKFRISKFILTCCAVDARPVGILVENEDWQEDFKENDWVEISGTLSFDSDKNEFKIITDSITSIEIPSNPYIY